MEKRFLLFLTVLLMPLLFSWTPARDKWIMEKQNGYSLFYTTPDKKNIEEYNVYFENGKRTVEEFFQAPFNTGFDIYIHPNRASLDSSWQKDWGMPEFRSQCWMVASGVAYKLDLISPKMWDSLSCEHSYSDTLNTQRLITHELVHVYHGQQNASPDFSDVSGMDWFVEGLAVYVSGQCDSTRITQVKKAISEIQVPETLEDFWTGNLRYGLSGTVVMYLDNQFGREKLVSLLKYNHIGELLVSLGTDESEIMDGWEKYMGSI
jgi:hypothetical protein